MHQRIQMSSNECIPAFDYDAAQQHDCAMKIDLPAILRAIAAAIGVPEDDAISTTPGRKPKDVAANLSPDETTARQKIIARHLETFGPAKFDQSWVSRAMRGHPKKVEIDKLFQVLLAAKKANVAVEPLFSARDTPATGTPSLSIIEGGGVQSHQDKITRILDAYGWYIRNAAKVMYSESVSDEPEQVDAFGNQVLNMFAILLANGGNIPSSPAETKTWLRVFEGGQAIASSGATKTDS